MAHQQNEEAIRQPLETISTEYNPPSREDARWMFDYLELYWEIKSRLMGGWLTTDKHGNYEIKKPQGVKPLLNSQGIEQTMAVVNGFITKIQGLTVLDEDRVLDLCLDLYVKLAKMYYINMEIFEIDPTRASIVLRMIMSMYEANLRKSIGGASIKLLGQTERRVESTVNAPRKKFMGLI